MAEFIEGLFPEKRIHLIGGAAGSGKTTLLAWMLKKIQNGEDLFERPTRSPEGGVYFIVADRKWKEYQAPLEKTGLKLAGHYSYADDPDMTIQKFLHPNPVPLLREGFKKLAPKPNSIVVVDVFGLFLGADLRQYRPIMAYMWEYQRWTDELGITLIGTVHAGKQKSDAERYVRRFDRVMGAGALRGSCSTAAYLTSLEETGKDLNYQEFEILPRDENGSLIRVGWDNKDGLLKPLELMDPPGVEEGKLLALFPESGDGITSENLAKLAHEKLNIARTKTYDLIRKLHSEGRICRTKPSQRAGWIRLRVA